MPTLKRIALTTLLGACSVSPEPPAAPPAHSPRPPALRPVPGCEGCEAVWERDPATLAPRLRLAPDGEPGEPLHLDGTVYHPDGKTPAAGVVLYLHHTDATGRYSGGSDESEWSRRHGRLRGWLRTGADGRYDVDTILPAPYPDHTDPAHVHVFVLEPNDKDPYWIDDIVFAGQPGVDAAYAAACERRGGSGIVTLERAADGRWTATRDIVLQR